MNIVNPPQGHTSNNVNGTDSDEQDSLFVPTKMYEELVIIRKLTDTIQRSTDTTQKLTYITMKVQILTCVAMLVVFISSQGQGFLKPDFGATLQVLVCILCQ